MDFLDLTLPTLAENLALDEALLLQAEAGGPEMLRLWQWPQHAVVLGAGGRVADDVDVEACRADDVPLARRASGGGTVLLGPGCLLYTVVLAFDCDPALQALLPSFQWVLGRIVAMLPDLALRVQGSSDLTLDDRKVSGNAQQRKRDHFLQHGTLLYAFDVDAVACYLKAPPRQPDYRRQRSHRDFLTNLPLSAAALTQALRHAFGAATPGHWSAETVRQLVQEKYARPEWIERR
jgi:lipoate-protein ligase A